MKLIQSRHKKTTVVIEIGNDWLKILESQASPSQKCLTKASFTKLAHIKERVSGEIARIFKDLNLDKKSVITYIPRHLLTVRVLHLPSTDPKEISDMVNLQVGKQTPYSKDEIISAHKILESEREGYTGIMLVIARRNIISERLEALAGAGIEAKKVAVSSEGVYEWFNAAYMQEVTGGLPSDGVLVVADVDSNYSDFIVIRKGKLAFTRNIFIGANHFAETGSGWYDKFTGELKHSIELYQVGENGAGISKIFLSGAARSLPELERFVGAKLDMPVETLNPLKNMRVRKGSRGLEDEGNFKSISISPLIGIAIKGSSLALDLTTSESRIQKLMDEKRKSLMITGVLAAAIALAASCFLLIFVYNKTAYIREVKEKIAKIETSADEVETMRIRISLIEKRLDAKGASINILNEIYKLTPVEIYLTGINIREKKEAILKGRARAMSDVFKFITTLEDSGIFANVKTSYTTTKKEGNVEYADFEIICLYEKGREA